MGGGDWINQRQEQQTAFIECNTKREFYKQLREYKLAPVKEKVDITLQVIGILHGYTVLVVIPLIIGAVFWKNILDLIKNRVRKWVK